MNSKLCHFDIKHFKGEKSEGYMREKGILLGLLIFVMIFASSMQLRQNIRRYEG